MPAQMTTEDIELAEYEFSDTDSFPKFVEKIHEIIELIPAEKMQEATISFKRITRGWDERDEPTLEIVVAYPRMETEAEIRERERCDAYNRKQRRDYYLKLKAEFETEEA